MRYFGRLSIIILVISFCHTVSGQTKNMLEVFENNFKKATLEVKLEVLKDALDLKLQGMDELFSDAIRYCIDNYKNEKTSAAFKEMILISVKRVHETGYKPAVLNLIELLPLETETIAVIEILNALSDLGPEEPVVIKSINKYLVLQNESFRTAKTFNPQIVGTCLTDLGKLGDQSSFSPVLISIILRYSDDIVRIAEDSMGKLKGELKQNYMTFILEEQFIDKRVAFRRALDEKNLTTDDKCSIAEFSLNVAIHTAVITQDNKAFAEEIRMNALEYLSKNKWSHAAGLLIENFNIGINAYDKGLTGKTILLAAIDSLGNMASHEAAQRLTLYLDYLNSYTERGKAYDEEIVLHVVKALKNLGDLIAQESLLYTRYLDYSNSVKKAASDALQTLK